MLQVLGKRLRLSGDFDFGEIARLTPGFVGADLAALTQEAAALAVRRVFAALEGPAGEADVVSTAYESSSRPLDGLEPQVEQTQDHIQSLAAGHDLAALTQEAAALAARRVFAALESNTGKADVVRTSCNSADDRLNRPWDRRV